MIKNYPRHTAMSGTEPQPTPYVSVLDQEREQRLMIQGCTEIEAEKLVKSQEPDLEEIVERLLKWQEMELRRLAKL